MHMWGSASPKSAGQANSLETQGRVDVAAQDQRQSRGRTPSSSGDLSLFLLRSSTDWMRPTHILYSHLLYSKSTNIKVHLILK